MGNDTITGPFRMVSMGGFPGVVYDERISGANTIFGELYSMEAPCLKALDWLEGYPRFYERTKFQTDLMDKKAWLYWLPYEWLDRKEKEGAVVTAGIWHPNTAEETIWRARGIEVKDL